MSPHLHPQVFRKTVRYFATQVAITNLQFSEGHFRAYLCCPNKLKKFFSAQVHQVFGKSCQRTRTLCFASLWLYRGEMVLMFPFHPVNKKIRGQGSLHTGFTLLANRNYVLITAARFWDKYCYKQIMLRNKAAIAFPC